MNQYAEEFKKDIEKEVDGNCPIELQVFPPLGSAEAFALIRERKGDEADRIWQEVVNELAASEEGEKVNALSIESNIHGLIDTLDVFDEETPSSDDAGDAQ